MRDLWLRLSMVLTVAVVSCSLCADSHAQWAKPKAQAVQEDQEGSVVAQEAEVKAEAPRKKTAADLAADKAAQTVAAKKAEWVKAAKDKLNNSSWAITLTETSGKTQGQTTKDTLRFTESSKIESEKLVSEGFSPSNFTLRIKREDKAIWETMQTGKDGELAFWRGDLKRDPKDGTLGDIMNGVLSVHKNDKNKTVTDYSFVSEGKETIKPGAPKKIIEPAAVEMTEESAAVEERIEEKNEPEPVSKKKNFWGN